MAANEIKKGLFSNTNSNAYIVLYSVVMVVVVAVLLSVAALALKPRQDANALNEKQEQIVKALGEDPSTVKYDDRIAEALLLDAKGNTTSNDKSVVFEKLQSLKDALAEGSYPLFKATDGSVVIPVFGNGLWGDIWGYVALAADMNTIKGVVFDHKGETPGLGAEIATPKHQAKYVGKTIYNGAELVGISLVKGGAKAGSASFDHEVDAITGGTKTSDGVTEMLKTCLKAYQPYFDSVRSAAEANDANELTNENSENNE